MRSAGTGLKGIPEATMGALDLAMVGIRAFAETNVEYRVSLLRYLSEQQVLRGAEPYREMCRNIIEAIHREAGEKPTLKPVK